VRPTENPAVASIARQYDHTFSLLRKSILCFDADQWREGISSFEVPVKVAYHTLQCLLYYFRDDPKKTYREVPRRFGKDWWELDEKSLPDQSQVMELLEEAAGLVGRYLSRLSDADLGAPFSGDATIMENLIYALRHTMHHQGGLNLLSVHHGIDADLWE
jgi:hypothetical protein